MRDLFGLASLIVAAAFLDRTTLAARMTGRLLLLPYVIVSTGQQQRRMDIQRRDLTPPRRPYRGHLRLVPPAGPATH